MIRLFHYSFFDVVFCCDSTSGVPNPESAISRHISFVQFNTEDTKRTYIVQLMPHS